MLVGITRYLSYYLTFHVICFDHHRQRTRILSYMIVACHIWHATKTVARSHTVPRRVRGEEGKWEGIESSWVSRSRFSRFMDPTLSLHWSRRNLASQGLLLPHGATPWLARLVSPLSRSEPPSSNMVVQLRICTNKKRLIFLISYMLKVVIKDRLLWRDWV